MAVAPITKQSYQGVWVFGWDLVAGETGTAILVAPWPDKTVQIYGTFSTGALSIEGALDRANPTYIVLRDVPGQAISAKTAAYCEAVQQHCVLIRPVATTITAVSVRIICSAARNRTAS
jgi:hypothetical protein